MMRTLALVVWLMAPVLLVPSPASAQEYFQQEVNYQIRVSLDDQDHMLRGFEKIHYTNNAPEALEKIHFHLWPNAYKNNQTTLAREQFRKDGKHYLFRLEDQRGYIDSLRFRVDGKPVEWDHHPDHIDVCTIELNEPLESGETVTITTPFRVKIPLGVTSRLGHIGQSYKITQWYPKPAVYDQRGWHAMPYRDMGEFYSEYGRYEVSITLPENYVVAATGSLQTPSEKEWLKNKALDTKGQFSFDPGDMDFPASSAQTKTIRYTIDSTHDFAWFADKRYHVMLDSVKLPRSGRHVRTWAFFTNDQAELWRNATNYINEAIAHYSRWYGDYAWDNCSAILGAAGSRGNGMEYPTITAIGHTQEPKMLETVIMHEVGHNWFYGMLGFNERRYPFLDEGINTFSEIRYMDARYPNLKLYDTYGMSSGLARILGIEHMKYRHQHELLYLIPARQNKDQPTNTPSAGFTGLNYGSIPYSKTGLAFKHLEGYLGRRTFDQAMRRFFHSWKFKHPYPEDLQNTFEKNTDRPLDWFFDSVAGTSKKIDYRLKRVKGNRVLVSNRGEIAAPLVIGGIREGKTIFTRWYDGFKGEQWLDIPDDKVDLYRIDPHHEMLELYRHNNTLRSGGILKKVEPLKIEFLGLVNNPRFTQVHVAPSLGWNYYDKTMLGVTLYEAILPPDHFDYFLSPLYSTARKVLSGQGQLDFNLYPDGTFQRVRLHFSGKQYGYQEDNNLSYNRLRGEVQLRFKKQEPRKRGKTELSYAFTRARKIEDLVADGGEKGYRMFHELSFVYDKKTLSINPHRLEAQLEYGGDFLKGSIEANYKLSYYRNEGLNIRFFGGAFLYREDGLPWFYAYHLSGSSGMDDYTYNRTFLGRFEQPGNEVGNQFLAQQFYPDEGAFALYSNLGRTREWLTSLNIRSSLPLLRNIPVQAYAHVGVFGNNQPLNVDIANSDWAFETGIRFSFIELLDIYFPVAASNNLEKASDLINTRYGEKIRFHLKFDLVNPSRLTDQFDF